MLPLIIGKLIPEINEIWMLILYSISLVNSLCAITFNIGDIEYLKILIESYNSKFHMFPTISIKPKRHYSIHLPMHIECFGPLINTWTFIWTIRFKVEHSFFK